MDRIYRNICSDSSNIRLIEEQMRVRHLFRKINIDGKILKNTYL